jgi:uncharacterized protein (TIGR03000 family)
MLPLSLSPRIPLALLLALSAAPLVHSQAPDPSERRAAVVVRVHPNAKLTVEGQPTNQKGELRRFFSPPLEPGKKYFYTVVAEWMPNNNYETWTVTRQVSVEAGKTVEVDLRKADPKKGDKLFIRYVPTPPEIVEAMMKLARVGKDDVVYDLGCGDGRMVVAAVQKFHAKRGVGIDLDPHRLEEARENAANAGVEKKVEFREGDVLRVKDLSDATVVMLYLSDDLNKLLRPLLEKQLKPGARIVSHRFLMGDWKPDKTETHTVAGGWYAGPYRIHLWSIPKKDGAKKEDKIHSGK